MQKVELHTPAPDFNLVSYQGEKITLADFRGKTLILVFNRGFL